MSFIQFFGTLEIGLVYGLVAVGVYISFRVLDFPDLTVDGSFPMGAALCGILILNGTNPWLATLAAMLGGTLAGLVTAALNIYGRILHLLASILTMTALYSVNLRILGRPNIALINESTVFQQTADMLASMNVSLAFPSVVIGLVGLILALVVLGLTWFLQTNVGLAMRATGKNVTMATAQGVKTDYMVLAGIALSNALIALSGAIFTQSQGFADVTMGVGTIIVGLASVLIGEALFNRRSILVTIVSCVMGSVAYRLVIALALNSQSLGLEASDLQLVSAVLVGAAMTLSRFRDVVKRAFSSEART